MHYLEHQPRPPLDQWVKCVWTLVDDATVGSVRPLQPIVPDGCIEIVFHFGDALSRLSEGSEVGQPHTLVVGQMTGPTLLRPGSNVRALGIRLLPWGGRVLFQMPICELTDRFLPVRELLPRFDSLADQLAAAPADERPRLAFSHLRKWLPVEPAGPLTKELVRAIVGSGGRTTVRELASTVNATTRSVERVMNRDIGLPPLLFARIVRVQKAIGRMRNEPPGRLGRIAMDCGYYDQAHFCRDFRQLSGMTPTQFVAADCGLTHAFAYGDTQ
ncbi:MAG: helix-turn-helix domain-containing protein, partial [Gemmatimonadota bacterium]